MRGDLTPEEINAVLYGEAVGRIGCSGDGRTYIVPITYVFDGESVYGHSAEGLKLRMMRANPQVCFQVDQRENLANWRSVIAWGVYEELQGKEAIDALQILVAGLMPVVRSQQARLPHPLSAARDSAGLDRQKTVVFRIRFTERTGRFEKT
jgi:nitroimidazol reductase NimA-like FMN-containing flavoprotein (pyridoxamine 5'-phosphate oxidase superfamily)